MSERVQALERGIDILMVLAAGPKTLTEICRETGLSKATAYRLLANLGYRQLVIKDPAGSLHLLGPGFLKLVQSARQGLGSIGVIARPAMVEAVAATGETLALHVRLGGERICVEEVQSPLPIRYAAVAGQAAPLHVGAAGKALLAFLDEPELERTLASLPLQRVTERSTSDLCELRRELARIREVGYATSTGERFAGAAAISMPVQSDGDTIAVVSVLGPADRFSDDRRPELLTAVRVAAAQIEAAIKQGADARPDIEAAS